MEQPTGTEKVVLTTASGAFFGAAAGSIESVWSIPKLGAKLPKFSAQLKHVALRSVVFATVGCVFATGEFISASVRQKNDAVNAGVGGALVGVVPAILKKNARLGAAVSLLGGTAMAASTYWTSSQETAFDKYEKTVKATQAQ